MAANRLRHLPYGGLFGFVLGSFSTISYFQNFTSAHREHHPAIAKLSLALGISYLFVAITGSFGYFGLLSGPALMQRGSRKVILASVILVLFASTMLAGANLAVILTWFLWKDQFIEACTKFTSNQEIIYYTLRGTLKHRLISPEHTKAWCDDVYNGDAITAFFIMASTAIAAWFAFASLHFVYYRHRILDALYPLVGVPSSSTVEAMPTTSHSAPVNENIENLNNPDSEPALNTRPPSYKPSPDPLPTELNKEKGEEENDVDTCHDAELPAYCGEGKDDEKTGRGGA